MKITNISDRSRVIAATSDIVEPGDSVEVADDLGASLCEQTDRWAKAQSKTKSAASGEEKS